MKKISKIIICCIMAVTVIALTCFSTFADASISTFSPETTVDENYGYYAYTVDTENGKYKDNLPILVDSYSSHIGFAPITSYSFVDIQECKGYAYANSLKSTYDLKAFPFRNLQGYALAKSGVIQLVFQCEWTIEEFKNLIDFKDTYIFNDAGLITFHNDERATPKYASIDLFFHRTSGDFYIKHLSERTDFNITVGDLGVTQNSTPIKMVADGSVDKIALRVTLSADVYDGFAFDVYGLYSKTSLPHEYDTYKANKDGYNSGKNDSNEVNYDKGYEQGSAEGFEQGRAEGFEQGRTEGYEEGKLEGIEIGKDAALEGVENSNAVLNFFQGILNAVQGTLNTFFNLDVFGFTLGNIVAILFVLLVVIVVIKIIF